MGKLIIVVLGICLALAVALVLTRPTSWAMRWNDEHNDRLIIAVAVGGFVFVAGAVVFQTLFRAQ
ncbi:MAG: hypothetical protein ACC660_08610 [Acidimicrobiales bacterium]